MSATSAIAVLKSRLATLATVRTGRAALETTSADLPVITLYSVGDARAAAVYYENITYTRRLIVEYKAVAGANYDTALDTALTAIRAVISPDVSPAPIGQWLDGHALRLEETSAAFFAPAPNSNEAVLQVNLEFDY